MKKQISYILLSVLLLLFLNGCGSNSNADLFQFKGSNIGDNSAVINILRQLPQNKTFKQVSLQTKKEPYGMVLEYRKSSLNEKAMKEMVITNATYIFALVKNAMWITFDIGDLKYTVTRENLQEQYGKDVSNFKNVKDIKSLIQKYIEKEGNLNQFFN